MTGRLIKICGLKDPSNILEVISLNPDFIGFIFYPDSPRYLSRARTVEFLNNLSGHPQVVGVFVDPLLDTIREVRKTVKLDLVQLHGSESPEFCEKVRNEGYRIIKAFGIYNGFDFGRTLPFEAYADFFLFDTAGSKHGGTGHAFDWKLLEGYQGKTPFLLSGGISPETLIFPKHPRLAGVDLNSRFETSPGIKDTGLLQKFIKRFRDE